MQKFSVVAGVVLLAVAASIAILMRDSSVGAVDSDREEPRIDSRHLSQSRTSAGVRKSSARQGSTVRRGPIYAGPESLEEWIAPAGERDLPESEGQLWEFRDGTLRSDRGGMIAREVSLPESCRFGFRFRWSEQLRARVLIFADQGDTSQPDNCYDLVIQRRFAYLRKRWKTRESAGSRIIGQTSIGSLIETQEVAFEFLFYRDDGTIGLFVDGKREAVWTDQEFETGEFGDWVQFHAEELYPLEVSEITADEWDGMYPDTGESHAPDPTRTAELTPPGGWGPAEELRRERQRIRTALQAALETADGPERQAVQHKAIRANVEAQQKYEEAFARLPEATPVEGQPGIVINPFTGESLDVRGVMPGSPIRDPRTGRDDQVFRIP